MSNFSNKMIEDGFEDPEDYMRYLEGLSLDEYVKYNNLDIEEEHIYALKDDTIVTEKTILNSIDKNSYEYFILPRDENWNKVVIKSIGTMLIPNAFNRKYCYDNGYFLNFCTYNFTEYHDAELSITLRSLNVKEHSFYKRILSGDINAFNEASEYYKNELFIHDSENWGCSWDSIEIIEIDGEKCLKQIFSIHEGKYRSTFNRNNYTFFLGNYQLEIHTRYDFTISLVKDYNWKKILETTINSFKISKKLKRH